MEIRHGSHIRFPETVRCCIALIQRLMGETKNCFMSRAMRKDLDFDEWRQFEDRAPDDRVVGPARAAEISGRCKDCWGPVTVAKDGADRCINIQCRSCGRSVKDEDAVREAASMKLEEERNIPRARVGSGSKYREDARFVLKILPDMDRDTAKFNQRVADKASKEREKGWLDRRDYPPGEAGYLYAQARAFLFGLENLPRELSAVSLSDFDFGKPQIDSVDLSANDGSVHITGTIPSSYRKPSNRELMARMGTTMMAGMTAAFACELAMKAILMTRLDKAKKTHDLAELYDALPRDCRERLEADFAVIAHVLKENRQTFDKWRYFEKSAGGDTMTALVNTDRVWGLVKAARVIVDECVIVGLSYEIHVNSTFAGVANRGHRWSEMIRLSVVGKENAIPWDQVLTAGTDWRQ